MSKDFDFEKLKGSENYHTWAFAAKNVLAYKGLENCISDPVTETKEDKLRNCKALLCLSVDSSIYAHIIDCATAEEIWKKLKNLYEDKGLSRKIGLLRNLISTRLEDCSNMQEYTDKILNYTNKLTGIGFKMTNEWTGAILLAGLTEHYRPFIMGLEASESEITSDKIVSKLLDAEGDNPAGGAFFGKNKNKNRNNNRRKNKSRICYVCGSKDHYDNACDNQNSKGNKRQHDTAKNAFSAFQCKANNNDWYVDSGASSHMTHNKKLLSEEKTVNNRSITSANNAK